MRVPRWGAIALAIIASQVTTWANIMLAGNYLSAGVDVSGGLVHDLGGGSLLGLRFDPAGGGSFSTDDFIAPGSAFEFYSIGVTTGTTQSYAVAGYTSGNPFAVTTTDTSAGSVRSAHSVGTWASASLDIVQDLWFASGRRYIHFEVTLTNAGSSTLQDVVYARGFDPDQDAQNYSESSTDNQLTGSTPSAYGPYTDWSIGIRNIAGTAQPSADLGWSTDPYFLYYGYPPFLPPPDSWGYNYATINTAWSLGDLAPNESKTIQWRYEVAQGPYQEIAIPEPSSLVLVGVGLLAFAVRRRRATG